MQEAEGERDQVKLVKQRLQCLFGHSGRPQGCSFQRSCPAETLLEPEKVSPEIEDGIYVFVKRCETLNFWIKSEIYRNLASFPFLDIIYNFACRLLWGTMFWEKAIILIANSVEMLQ